MAATEIVKLRVTAEQKAAFERAVSDGGYRSLTECVIDRTIGGGKRQSESILLAALSRRLNLALQLLRVQGTTGEVLAELQETGRAIMRALGRRS